MFSFFGCYPIAPAELKEMLQNIFSGIQGCGYITALVANQIEIAHFFSRAQIKKVFLNLPIKSGLYSPSWFFMRSGLSKYKSMDAGLYSNRFAFIIFHVLGKFSGQKIGKSRTKKTREDLKLITLFERLGIKIFYPVALQCA